jgi:hypothetical protein
VSAPTVRDGFVHELTAMAKATRSKGQPLRASVFDAVATTFRDAPAETSDEEFRDAFECAIGWMEAFADVEEPAQ